MNAKLKKHFSYVSAWVKKRGIPLKEEGRNYAGWKKGKTQYNLRWDSIHQECHFSKYIDGEVFYVQWNVPFTTEDKFNALISLLEDGK